MMNLPVNGLGDFLCISWLGQFRRSKLVSAGQGRRIPAAAQGFHQIDGRDHAPLQNRDRRLLVVQRDGLRRNDVEIGIGSGLVAGDFESQRLLGGYYGFLLLLGLFGQIAQGRQIVLDLLKSGKNGLPISGDRGIVGGLGALDLGAAAAEVEQSLRNRRTGRPAAAAPGEQIRRCWCSASRRWRKGSGSG